MITVGIGRKSTVGWSQYHAFGPEISRVAIVHATFNVVIAVGLEECHLEVIRSVTVATDALQALAVVHVINEQTAAKEFGVIGNGQSKFKQQILA